MIPYAQDTAAWEDWQRDYRLGLILVLPPPAVSRLIDPLRQRYDPRSHATCAAHVSVSDPLRLEMTAEREEELRSLLAGVDPFELRYGPPRASAERAGVACPVGPQERVDALKETLHRAAVFEGGAYRRRGIPAHMTIAEFVTVEEGLRIAAELRDEVPGGSFDCGRLDYIVPDEGFRFRRALSFSLGPLDITGAAVL